MRYVALFASSLVLIVAAASCSTSDSASSGAAGSGTGGDGGAAGSGGGAPDASDENAPDVGADTPLDSSGVECPHDSVTNVPYTGCDLVKQDCPLGQTCFVYQLGTNWKTHCIKLGSGLGTRGDACSSGADCDSGLTCVSGHCSPFCCSEYQDAICGPGGTCSVKLQFDQQGTATANVCVYGQLCDLWSNACPQGTACRVIVQETGMSTCVELGSGAATAEGAPCSTIDECGDSMVCLNDNGGGHCRYYCRRDDSGGPADAGVVGGGPGAGGCPTGQTCQALGTAPTWLGVCAP
jgi:hypothetical protein